MLGDYAKFATAMAKPTYDLLQFLYKTFKGDSEKAAEEMRRYVHITNHGQSLDSVQRINDARIDAARQRARENKKT